MKVAGIIAEYNPFHNGHKYHLDKAREMTGADYCIVVMSGNYTQRGEPALMDKYLRTRSALENGADLVLELPVCHACASAPGFADGAVSLLQSLGVVDCLVFGSESGSTSLLQEAAAVLASEPPLYHQTLKCLLRSGLSYPSAQSDALLYYLQSADSDSISLDKLHPQELSALLSSANNLLGIAYCRSLLSFQSSILPVAILREGSSYSDSALPEEEPEAAPALKNQKGHATNGRKMKRATGSALAIRATLKTAGTPDCIRPYVPDNVYTLMQKEYHKRFPVFPDMLSQMLHYKLLSHAADGSGFSDYLDVSPDLSDRILRHLPEYRSFSSFCLLLKTKELTYTRISRCLLHIFLDIKKSALETSRHSSASYARILGFQSQSAPLLTAIKANTSIPLVSKLADAGKVLSEDALHILKKDVQAAHLYNALILHAYETRLPDETRRQIIRI